MTTDELRATAERLVAAYDLTRSMTGGPRRNGVMDAADVEGFFARMTAE